MGVSTQTVQRTVTQFVFCTDVRITNLDINITGSEFSHVLITGLKQLMIKSRVGATIRYCFVAGETASKYMTLKPGTVLHMSDLSFAGKVIYFLSDKAGVVEIQESF